MFIKIIIISLIFPMIPLLFILLKMIFSILIFILIIIMNILKNQICNHKIIRIRSRRRISSLLLILISWNTSCNWKNCSIINSLRLLNSFLFPIKKSTLKLLKTSYNRITLIIIIIIITIIMFNKDNWIVMNA
jgi:hypothetical protein